jgi:hypothetical protein
MAVSASGPSASDPSEAEAEAEVPIEDEEEEEEEARTARRRTGQQALTRLARASQEPQLVYSRVAGEAPHLLAADVATAVALCGRLVAVGTRRGVVVLCGGWNGIPSSLDSMPRETWEYRVRLFEFLEQPRTDVVVCDGNIERIFVGQLLSDVVVYFVVNCECLKQCLVALHGGIKQQPHVLSQ